MYLCLVHIHYTAPGTPYQVRVVAYNSAGRGVLGNNRIFFSEELTPAKPPENIQVTQLNTTSVNITWTPLTLFEAQGFPKYIVSLTVSSTTRQQRRQSNHFTLTTNNSFVVLINLKSGSFSIIVGATTGNGSDAISSNSISGNLQCMLFSYRCSNLLQKYMIGCTPE